MKKSLHGEVKTYYLSKEDLEKIRWGAKCDLEDRPKGIRHVNWKWKRKNKVSNS